jgi:arginine/glutamate-rich protein 1
VEEAIRKRVEESLNSEEIKLEIQRRIEEGRKKMLEDVAIQLDKEKDVALIEARQKEVVSFNL